jgi:hypothetical protein
MPDSSDSVEVEDIDEPEECVWQGDGRVESSSAPSGVFVGWIGFNELLARS